MSRLSQKYKQQAPLRRILTFAAVFLSISPSVALASQTVHLAVAFSSDKPGIGSTIHTHVTVAGPAGQVPSPVTNIKFTMPRGIGLGSSELGLATCSAAILLKHGPAGCSPNSKMGFGTAVSVVPIGPDLVHESVAISLFSIEPVDGHTAMLFYVNGKSPVSAQLVLPAVLLPAGGGSAFLNTDIPLTPSLPGASDVAVVDMRTSIGPEHLTYYRRVHGRRVGFQPAGIAIPARCPHGGFRFNTVIAFQDGTSASSNATVPCARAR